MLEKGSFPKKKQGKKHRGGGKRIHPCTLLFCVRMYSVHALRELVVNRQLSGKEKERSLLLKEGRREKAETHAKLSSPTPISTPRASHSPSVCLPPTFFFAVRVQNSERRQQQDTKRYSQLGPFLFALIQYTVYIGAVLVQAGIVQSCMEGSFFFFPCKPHFLSEKEREGHYERGKWECTGTAHYFLSCVLTRCFSFTLTGQKGT